MAPTSSGQAGGDTGHCVDRASCRTEQARTRRCASPGRRGALLLSSAARHDGRQRPPGRPHSPPRGRPRAPSGTESCSKMRGGHGITRIPWRRDSHGSRFCGERKLWTLASPPSPGGLKITHTQRMFAAEQSRRREAGGSRGKPRLAHAPAAATLLVTGRGASSKPGDSSTLFLTARNNPNLLLCSQWQRERRFSFPQTR